MIDLCHIDEAGFAPTLPVCSSWSLVGSQLCPPYEAPQGRRVNAIGAYFSHGPEAGHFESTTYATVPKSQAKKHRKTLAEQAAAHGLTEEEVGPIDGERFVQFVWRVAGRPVVYAEGWRRGRPLVIVIDNYSVHHSERVQQEQEAFERAGITLFYLPAYSPKLSRIEPIWRAVKYHELTTRSYAELAALKRAVEEALARKAEKLLAEREKTTQLLRSAA